METVDISTGQHVTIRYLPAGTFERMMATVLDWMIQYFYIILVFILHVMFYANNSFLVGAGGSVKTVIFLLFLVPVAFYNFLFEAFMHGQTPGKKLLKIRITNVDGSTTSIGSHFLRWLIRPVDFFPLIGILGALFVHYTAKKQRIGDLAAGTIVVKTKQRVDIRAEYYTFEEDYTPLYHRADRLSEAQIRYILRRLDLPEKWSRKEIGDLSAKVKKALETDSDLPDRDFLVRVVKDYNYCASMGG